VNDALRRAMAEARLTDTDVAAALGVDPKTRSIHSTAVYQSLIMNPDDEAAFVLAGRILDSAARWRPLPDLTIVLTDDVDAAVGRAEARNGEAFTPSSGTCTAAPHRCSSGWQPLIPITSGCSTAVSTTLTPSSTSSPPGSQAPRRGPSTASSPPLSPHEPRLSPSCWTPTPAADPRHHPRPPRSSR
jgi:hypothetical protein